MDIDKKFHLVRKNEGNAFQRLMMFFLEQNKKHGAEFRSSRNVQYFK